jgi:putative membrane protein
MRDYKSGKWGFSLVWGIEASVFPRAVFLATPNAILAWLLSFYVYTGENRDESTAKNTLTVLAGFTSVLFFVLYFRSNIAYDRWWEGGTLLQKTRGEWFNAYSSLIAFSATDPAREGEVEEFHHLLARLMSLLFCCGLQQVSPNKETGFEIIDTSGIEAKSLQFLNESSDKVEVILQWIQRSTVLHMQTGVLPVAPPVLSRAFQEVSLGIVNLQNARKIADFPFPFPFAQTSMVMLLIHWAATPLLCAHLLDDAFVCALVAFGVIFFIWCINYIALQLEQPFGTDSNDLPMAQMQRDWNKSIGTLLAKRAQRPPLFEFDRTTHRRLEVAMSDGTAANKRRMTIPASAMNRQSCAADKDMEDFEGDDDKVPPLKRGMTPPVPEQTAQKPVESKRESVASVTGQELTDPVPLQVSETKPTSMLSPGRSPNSSTVEQLGMEKKLESLSAKLPLEREAAKAGGAASGEVKVEEAALLSLLSRDKAKEEKHQPPLFPVAAAMDAKGFETQLRLVGARMKELHSCLIDEELGLLSALGTRLVMPDAKRKADAKVKLPVGQVSEAKDPGMKEPLLNATEDPLKAGVGIRPAGARPPGANARLGVPARDPGIRAAIPGGDEIQRPYEPPDNLNEVADL